MSIYVTHYRINKKNGHTYNTQWFELKTECKTPKELSQLRSNLCETFQAQDPDKDIAVDLRYEVR